MADSCLMGSCQWFTRGPGGSVEKVRSVCAPAGIGGGGPESDMDSSPMYWVGLDVGQLWGSGSVSSLSVGTGCYYLLLHRRQWIFRNQRRVRVTRL